MKKVVRDWESEQAITQFLEEEEEDDINKYIVDAHTHTKLPLHCGARRCHVVTR